MKRPISVLLSVLLLTSMTRGDEKPNVLPPELNWIPGKSVAFLHVRFGELWNGNYGPALRAALVRDDAQVFESIEKSLGVPPDAIDRVTILIPEVFGDTPSDSFLLRISTYAPYDQKRVLTSIFGAEKAATISRRLSRIIPLPQPETSLLFTDATNLTFAFGRASLVRAMEKPSVDGKLAAALRTASEKHLLVAGVDVSQARRIPWIADSDDLRPFFIARSFVLVGDATPSGIEFRAIVGVGLKSHGEEIAEAMTRQRAGVLNLLTATLKDRDAPAKTLETVITSLKSARIEQRDRVVTASFVLSSAEPLSYLAIDAIDTVHATSHRSISQNNLKQLGLAFHNYHDANGWLPTAVKDKKGRPLLSWRVEVLPYIEHDTLYRQFKRDEPWDSEHNKKLIAQMPKLFALPGDRRKHDLASTYYRVFVDNGAMFDSKQKTNFAAITDGLSNTIMCVEAAEAVPWTKPDEIEYNPKKPPALGFHFAGRGNVLFGDGAVRTLRRRMDERTLHLLIQRADGNPVEIPN